MNAKNILTSIYMTEGTLFLSILTYFSYRAALYYPENHVSIDLRWLYPLGICGIIAATIDTISKRNAANIVLFGFVMSLACILFVFTLDHFNILISHSVWIQRGMPQPFQ